MSCSLLGRSPGFCLPPAASGFWVSLSCTCMPGSRSTTSFLPAYLPAIDSHVPYILSPACLHLGFPLGQIRLCVWVPLLPAYLHCLGGSCSWVGYSYSLDCCRYRSWSLPACHRISACLVLCRFLLPFSGCLPAALCLWVLGSAACLLLPGCHCLSCVLPAISMGLGFLWVPAAYSCRSACFLPAFLQV